MWQQPASDQGSHDAVRNVGDYTKACALNDLSRKPAGYQSDQQNDEKSLP